MLDLALRRSLLATVALCAAAFGAQANETLKLGLSTPLTGGGAAWGTASKLAAEILAAEINAKGGLDVCGTKYDIQVIAYDDQYKAAEAVAAYNRLYNQDGVRHFYVLGSATAMGIKQMVEDDDVVAVTTAFTPDAIDDNTKHMVRMNSTSLHFMPGYVKWMTENLKERKIVSLNPNDDSGWGNRENTGKAYRGNGFEVLSEEAYERDTKDFAPLLTKILAMNPEIIDLGSSAPPTAALIARQARELGFKGRFVQTGGGAYKEILEAVGPEGAEGLVNMVYTDRGSDGFKRLAEEYRKVVGQEPNEMIVPYYDGFNAFMHAIAASCDPYNPEAVVAAFQKALPLDSVQGGKLTWSTEHKNQVLTTEFVSVMENGETRIKGQIQ